MFIVISFKSTFNDPGNLLELVIFNILCATSAFISFHVDFLSETESPFSVILLRVFEAARTFVIMAPSDALSTGITVSAWSVNSFMASIELYGDVMTSSLSDGLGTNC